MVQIFRFDHRKAGRNPVQGRGVNLDYGKSCRSTLEAQRVGFEHHKASRNPVFNLDHGKLCKSTVKVRRVHFHHHKACRMPVVVLRVRCDHRQAYVRPV